MVDVETDTKRLRTEEEIRKKLPIYENWVRNPSPGCDYIEGYEYGVFITLKWFLGEKVWDNEPHWLRTDHKNE